MVVFYQWVGDRWGMSQSRKRGEGSPASLPCPYIISRSEWFELRRPDYIVYRLGESTFKVVRFRVKAPGLDYITLDEKQDGSEEESPGLKLANNLSRAKKTAFEIALCNPWTWFITITLDRKKVNDRYDLIGFQKQLSDWIKNRRRAYGTDLKYFLIPEHHKDGAWHLHGFIEGVPENQIQWHGNDVPASLRAEYKRQGYKNWVDCGERWGFVTMGLIKDQYKTACYVTKYISKDLGGRSADLGKHLYYASLRLKRAERAGEHYGNSEILNACIQKNYDFCSVGMIEKAEQDFPRQTCNVLPFGEPETKLTYYGPMGPGAFLDPPLWKKLPSEKNDNWDPYEIDPYAYDRNRNELAQMRLW